MLFIVIRALEKRLTMTASMFGWSRIERFDRGRQSLLGKDLPTLLRLKFVNRETFSMKELFTISIASFRC